MKWTVEYELVIVMVKSFGYCVGKYLAEFLKADLIDNIEESYQIK